VKVLLHISSTISCVQEDFHSSLGGVAVPKRALPGRDARAVLDPFGAPFHDRLGINPYTLDEAGVDGLLALGGCLGDKAWPSFIWGGRRMPRV